MIQDYGFLCNEQCAISNEQFPQNLILCKTRFGKIVHCQLHIAKGKS